MSTSSQTHIVVTFDGIDLAPLTTRTETLTEDVERYLQRIAPGELWADVNTSLGLGCARSADRTVANFRIAALGGAA